MTDSLKGVHRMAALDDLLARVSDPALRADLEREIAPLRGEQELGLVFERHLPETVRLPGHPVRRGLTVTDRAGDDDTLWQVVRVTKGVAHLRRTDADNTIVEEVRPVEELVVVREFGEPIYPGLQSVGRVKRGGDKPFHTVINAENYHALEMLAYTCEGQVDAIYIDPPYATGKDSWTYNDRFVEATDAYRHSLWLAFMERRLRLAVRLLKASGILMVSIDDNQQARLKLLCDSILGEANFVSTLVWKSKSGGANDSGIAVDHEYILVYRRSESGVILPDPFGTATTSYSHEDATGRYALERLDKQNLSYSQSLDYDLVGPDGTVYKLRHRDPGRPNANWRWSQAKVAAEMDSLVFERGNVYTKNYAKDAYVARSLLVDEKYGRTRTGGRNLSDALGSGVNFDYPKPVKLLVHLLAITTPKDALVLDFFGGSATLTEAVMTLNAADSGVRRSIVITNNEVSKGVADRLRSDGFIPGDAEWEAEGVFVKVAMPRAMAVTSGVRSDGTRVSDGFDENVECFKLTYENPDRVRLGAAFAAVAPLLWLRAGAQGPRVDQVDPAGWALPEDGRYGVLFTADAWPEFIDAARTSPTVSQAFIVTDSDAVFQQVVAELPDGVEPVRLYESYLTSFEINTGVRA